MLSLAGLMVTKERIYHLADSVERNPMPGMKAMKHVFFS